MAGDGEYGKLRFGGKDPDLNRSSGSCRELGSGPAEEGLAPCGESSGNSQAPIFRSQRWASPHDQLWSRQEHLLPHSTEGEGLGLPGLGWGAPTLPPAEVVRGEGR